MKKVKAMMAAVAMTTFLCGCYDPGQDVTLICPVTDYMAVDGGAIAVYEMDGERREKEFLETDASLKNTESRDDAAESAMDLR